MQRICAHRNGRERLVAEQLDWVLAVAHHSARTVGCIVRSVATPRDFSRTFASSFATVNGRDLIALRDRDKPPGLIIVYLRSCVQLAAKQPGADAGDLAEYDMAAAGADDGAALHGMSEDGQARMLW